VEEQKPHNHNNIPENSRSISYFGIIVSVVDFGPFDTI